MAAIDRYLKFAVNVGASDLHMALGRPPTVRLHGILQSAKRPALSPDETRKILTEFLTPEHRKVLEDRKSVDLCYDLDGVGRFRANVYHQRLGLAGAFRILPNQVPTLEELGMPPVIERLLSFRQGMVLLTGPAGCGKTTTLAAMVNHINETRNEHVITIEDPIEIVHQNKLSTITQREVRSHTESFAAAVRAALREDPDVILIGEMRDLETISIAITSAETGHLVLGTLNTPGASRTVNRVVDVFPPEQISQVRAMVSESLRGVISQQLVPRADGEGRVAALELLVCTPAIANMIREDRTFQIPSLMQIGIKQGMQLMEQSLKKLVETGVITDKEAARHDADPDALMKASASGEEADPGGKHA